MSMTYRELQEAITKMTDEQKDCNVTVYDEGWDEYLPVVDYRFDCDVLDDKNPFLVIVIGA